MCGIAVFLWSSCWERNFAPVRVETHSEIRAWEQLTQRVTDNERVEVEVWWMMMDDRGQGEKKNPNNSQIQNADRWRCHAFLKTVVWPCQRDRPVEEGGILPVYRHRLGSYHPSWKAPGTPVLQLQTKLRRKNINSLKKHNNTWKHECGFVHLAVLPFLMVPFLQWTIGGCVELFSHQSYSLGSELWTVMTLLIKETGSFALLPPQSYADVANSGGKDTTEDTMWQSKVQ